MRLVRLLARRDVQRRAERLPIAGWLARRDGAAIFDLVQGFVASQVLAALIELEVLQALLAGPASAGDLAADTGLPAERMAELLRAAAALSLVRRRRDGRAALARRGAAILGVPGLAEMIRHNRLFYDDMADPVARLRGEGETNLARLWPYVIDDAGGDPAAAARYSRLMAQSQALVAEETLAKAPLRGVRRLMDVGGGTGVFLEHALAAYPGLTAMLLDLPEVTAQAEARLSEAGLSARVTPRPGSFRDGELPDGADAISLIRVLYDHDDDSVAALLARAHAALPPGGRLIISEPMAGGRRRSRAGDLYFSFYTMAMGPGRVRSPARIAALCRRAGFVRVRAPRAPRPFVTQVVTCRRPT